MLPSAMLLSPKVSQVGAGKMTQLAKCLLSEHRGLHLDKIWVWCLLRNRSPRLPDLTIQAKCPSLGSVTVPALRTKVEHESKRYPVLTSDLHIHLHIHAPAQTHGDTHTYLHLCTSTQTHRHTTYMHLHACTQKHGDTDTDVKEKTKPEKKTG